MQRPAIGVLSLLVILWPLALTTHAADDTMTMDLVVTYDEVADSAALEWFPAFSDEAASFEIRCYDGDGALAALQTVGAQDRTGTIDQVFQAGMYEVEVRALDVGGAEVEITPREQFQVPEGAEPPPARDGVLDISLVSCDSRNFPFIYITARVTEDGLPIDDLTSDNFSVTEDGRLQTDFFDVTPPEAGGGVRLADIVFLIDTSGSMGPEIAGVRNNAIAFANALAATGIDYRLGLVQFGNSYGANPRIIGGGLTADAAQFVTWVSGLTASGGYEPGFAAIRLAIQGYNFRPGSQKVFILITDEDSDDRSKQATINLILANDVTVHCAVRCSFGTSNSDYCNASSVRGVSGGLLFSVEGPYDDVLDTIAAEVSDTYIARYRTDNPALDGQERLVVCTVTKDASGDFLQCSYIPGGAPIIERTADTIALHSQSLVAGSSPTIAVTVTDAAQPFVQSATLHVRVTGSETAYSTITMTPQGGDVYSTQVPGAEVQTPGLDYYIRATDGQVTSSDPSTDPQTNPYQLAVLPNVAPVIEHTPPSSGNPGQDLPLAVHVIDYTYYISEIRVNYRPQGTLLWSTKCAGYDAGDTDVTATITIPASSVVEPAIEYYIEAVDDLGVSNLWPLGGADAPHVLPIESQESWTVSWSCIPALPFGPFDVIMDQIYEMHFSATNTGEDVQTFDYGLVQDYIPLNALFVPTFWTWDLHESTACVVAPAGFVGPVPLYAFGNVRAVELAPGETQEYVFYISHHWSWIEPWNIGRVGSIVTNFILGYFQIPAVLNTILDLVSFLNDLSGFFIEPVTAIQYTYTGLGDVGDVPSPFVISTRPEKVEILGLSIIEGSVASLLTTAGFAALPIPVVGWAIAAGLFASEAIFWVQSEWLYVQAYDPDPNFTELASPEPWNAPSLAEETPEAVKIFAEISFELLPITKAGAASYARYLGALGAGSAHWAAVQLAATRHYMEQQATLVSQMRSLSEIFIPDIPIPTPEDISETRDHLAQQGLPEIEVEILQQFGWTNAEVDVLHQMLLSADDIVYTSFTDLPELLQELASAIATSLELLPTSVEGALTATVDFKPDTLNLGSSGTWVTCYVELPDEHAPQNIDLPTVLLNGVLSAEPWPYEVGDYDNDEIPDLMVKFNRQQVQALLEQGQQVISITGELSGGVPFGGIDLVRAIHGGAP